MSGFARRRVSHILRSGEHRAFGAPMNRNCTLWTLRVAWLKAFSLLRFFVALDKEMTCRHAQWLTVMKKLANSCRPLILLCHKFSFTSQQHGHRRSLRIMARAMSSRSVEIESGTWRCTRPAAARDVTFG